MNTQIKKRPGPGEQLYTTYGACLHQAASTHKDSGESFRFNFDDAVLALDVNDTMVLCLYEMYAQGLRNWRAKWEAAGERPPCLEADPMPFILEEERVAMERVIQLLRELRDSPRKSWASKKEAARRAATHTKFKDQRAAMLNQRAEAAATQPAAVPPKLVAPSVPDMPEHPTASISASIPGEKGRKV